MDPEMMLSLGQAGAAAVLGISAAGSALGTAAAGLAAVGVWKRCYAQEKPVPFILVTFIGAPLSQTIYGMILMNTIVRVASERMAASAYGQGRVGAAAADALGDTGKGLGNYLMAIGIVETVALFVLVFIQATL
jgi:V/A-type H+-transporting ATPase subunit K